MYEIDLKKGCILSWGVHTHMVVPNHHTGKRFELVTHMVAWSHGHMVAHLQDHER